MYDFGEKKSTPFLEESLLLPWGLDLGPSILVPHSNPPPKPVGQRRDPWRVTLLELFERAKMYESELCDGQVLAFRIV